jgi:hypothetical protein
MKNVKPATIHTLLWRSKLNQCIIIEKILSKCITEGYSRYWFYADFSGAWYRNAQNAWNDVALQNFPQPFPYSSAKVLTMSLTNYPNFEIPVLDLLDESNLPIYIDIDSFDNGIEKFAILYPEEYLLLMDYILTNNDNYMSLNNIFDAIFQMICLGKVNHKKNNH